jgi:hypothetical protein
MERRRGIATTEVMVNGAADDVCVEPEGADRGGGGRHRKLFAFV